MAFTAYRTWVASEIVSAAQFNEQIRDNGNAFAALRGMKQRVLTAIPNANVANSLSYTDLVSVAFTSTGGRLVIRAEPDPALGFSSWYMANAAIAGQNNALCRVLVDGANIGELDFVNPVISANTFAYLPPSGAEFYAAPGAGAHTIKLQGAVLNTGGNARTGFTNCLLAIEEWGTVAGGP